MKRLIVNADDFGLTSGVNRAILELHHLGVLTSATLMAKAAATEEAVQLALATPTLGVGCHIVLLDGMTITLVEQLPRLAWGKKLSPTLGSFLLRICVAGALGSQLAKDLESEAFAQISFLQMRGLCLTHIDTHKHTHMFPAVLRPVLRAARKAGIHAIRNPFEPAWSARATPGAPWLRRIQVQLLRLLEPTFRRIVAEEGFVTTNGALGVLATGTLTQHTVDSLLRDLPDGTWELVTHPGYSDTDLAHANTRLLASRETEIQALRSIAALPEIELGNFATLVPPNTSQT